MKVRPWWKRWGAMLPAAACLVMAARAPWHETPAWHVVVLGLAAALGFIQSAMFDEQTDQAARLNGQLEEIIKDIRRMIGGGRP